MPQEKPPPAGNGLSREQLFLLEHGIAVAGIVHQHLVAREAGAQAHAAGGNLREPLHRHAGQLHRHRPASDLPTRRHPADVHARGVGQAREQLLQGGAAASSAEEAPTGTRTDLRPQRTGEQAFRTGLEQPAQGLRAQPGERIGPPARSRAGPVHGVGDVVEGQRLLRQRPGDDEIAVALQARGLLQGTRRRQRQVRLHARLHPLAVLSVQQRQVAIRAGADDGREASRQPPQDFPRLLHLSQPLQTSGYPHPEKVAQAGLGGPTRRYLQ